MSYEVIIDYARPLGMRLITFVEGVASEEEAIKQAMKEHDISEEDFERGLCCMSAKKFLEN